MKSIRPNSTRRSLIALAVVAGVALAACGSDGDTGGSDATDASDGSDAPTDETTAAGGSEPADASGDGLVVGFASLWSSVPAVSNVNRGFEAQVEEMGGEPRLIEADISDPLNSQLSIIDQMIAEGVDAIAFWPLDDSAYDAVIERASDAGIPVFAHDAYADNLLDQVVTSVTHGRELRAKQGAQLICDQLSPDGGEILYGDFDVAIPTLVFLKEKFEQYLAECEAPIEIAAVFGNKTDDTEGGRAAAEPALLANPDVKAVFNYNDATAIGVAQAAEDLGMRDGLWIDGYNLGDDGIAALGSGRIDASWDYRGVQIGQALAKVMVDYASGANTEPAKVIMIWPRGYTPETIGELPTPDELIAQISEGVNLLEIDPDLYTESDTIPAPADNIPLPVVSN